MCKHTHVRNSEKSPAGTWSGLCIILLRQVAVCNLASIALNRFVKDLKFDFKQLRYVTKVIVRNLNKIIDVNFYPIPEVRLASHTVK